MISDQEDRWSALKIIYAVLFGVLMIGYLIIQAYDREIFPMPAWVALARASTAVFGICLSKSWKDKGFLFLAGLLVIQIIGVGVRGIELFFTAGVSESILNGLWVIGGCYSLGGLLSTRQLRQYLRILFMAWTIGTVVHCLLAVTNAWTDDRIVNLGNDGFWGIKWYGRLCVSYLYPNTAGMAMSVSGLVALYLLLTEKCIISKIIWFLSYSLIVVTLSLTDARTSFISFSAGVGVMIYSVVIYLMKERRAKRQGKYTRKQIMTYLTAAACMVMAFALSVLILLKAAPVFNQVRDSGGVIISVAEAEGQVKNKKQLITRGFSYEGVLNGRDVIWKTVIQYITENPKRLLFGDSVYSPMRGPNQKLEQLLGDPMAHCHNMFLEILLESGLVGLFTVIGFGIYTTIHALRIVHNETLPIWPRLIPAIPISILVGDLAECFGWFYEWKGPALPFLFITCGVINAIGSKEMKRIKHNNLSV